MGPRLVKNTAGFCKKKAETSEILKKKKLPISQLENQVTNWIQLISI